ncbi:hypothetical protein [Streptomyces sp. 891-h]|uniref:hypothetical protein n=1 Tax=unclassified Streptomyces TaxID=2593676 RepID=UPI001FAB1DE7|nr:hypothetical protein [Streptomyces sp. 891-h]UNZ16474.1 hypothetical protein HC362_04685 [Streptomyces sp. 891-h]
MRTRTLTRSLAVGLASLGLAAAGTASAAAGGHGHHCCHKEVHKKKSIVKVSDNDNIISDSAFFHFGPMISR